MGLLAASTSVTTWDYVSSGAGVFRRKLCTLPTPREGPGAYSGFVRRVGFNQQLFRLEITAGFVDTLELHPGIVGQ